MSCWKHAFGVTIFKPLVQRGQIAKDRHDLPEPIVRILYVLLDLAFAVVSRTVASGCLHRWRNHWQLFQRFSPSPQLDCRVTPCGAIGSSLVGDGSNR